MRDLSTLNDVFIHESAIVEAGSQIGPGTSVWHYSHLRSGARIGRDCMLGKDIYVGESAVIGDRVRIQNGVSVFNGVTLEDEVFVGPGVVFTNDLFPRAVNLIDPDFRPTVVRRGASLGAASVVVCGVEIGSYAMIGAGTVVVADVLPHACVVGNPSRRIGWSCRCGRRLREVRGDRLLFCCDICGRNYCTSPDGGDRSSTAATWLKLEGTDDDFDQ